MRVVGLPATLVDSRLARPPAIAGRARSRFLSAVVEAITSATQERRAPISSLFPADHYGDSMRINRLATAAVFASLTVLNAEAQYPIVPKTATTLKGSSSGDGPVVNYRAYQEPGETFRIVCQEPCTVNETTIYAFYSGFKQAKNQLVAFMGIDAIPVRQPFDIHIANDSWCGNFGTGYTGEAGSYRSYSGAPGSYGCFWYASRPDLFFPFTAENVAKVSYHLLTVHEYAHTIYYSWHGASYEDIVKAASIYVSGVGGQPPITDPCAESLNDVAQGKLINALCRLNGFQYSHLAPSHQALRALYNSGQKDPVSGSTTIYQHRQTLNAVLGSDTLDAFLASKERPPYVGDARVVSPAGGRVDLLAGFVSLGAPSGAVAANTTVTVNGATSIPSRANFTFVNIYTLTPAATSFSKPVELTIKYDPSSLPEGVPETTLRLFVIDDNEWVEVAGSRVDAGRGLVRAPISRLGTYGIFGTTVADPLPAVIVPVVASASGVGGSLFKTSAQIRNRGNKTISGRFVFHPQGRTGLPADPSLSYSLAPFETKSYADLVGAIGQSGLGSLDVVPNSGSLAPEVVTRVFNDGGSNGTSGFALDGEKSGAALVNGDAGVLLVPPNLVTQRFNVGFRTLSSGVNVTITVRNAAGAILTTTAPRAYLPDFLDQLPVTAFVPGVTFSGNESIHVTINSGSAFFYGAATDNRTQDPSVQIARSLALHKLVPADTLYIPAAASAPGAFNSFFRTEVQFSNTTSSPVSGRFVFHPAGIPAASSDPFLPYSLAPYQTKSIPDLLPALGAVGLGSVDVVSTTGPPPLVAARVFNDQGSAGTSGLTQPGVDPASVLQAGDFALLLVPTDLTLQRMNIGIRTLDRGAHVTLKVRKANFVLLKKLTRSFPAGFFQQVSASEFLGNLTLTGGESIEIYIDGGQAILYGASSDNTTNDPSVQLARRLRYFN